MLEGKQEGGGMETESKHIHIVVITVYCIYCIIFSINLLLCPIYIVSFAAGADSYV